MSKNEPKDEAEFRRHVMKLAAENGWKQHADPDLRMRMGNRGFPDLVLAREEPVTVHVHAMEGCGPDCDREMMGTHVRVIFRELKMPGKYLNTDQWDWEQLLKGAGLDHAVWRPTDWDKIEEELR